MRVGSNFLRNVLLADGVFAGVSGVLLAALSGVVGPVLGVAPIVLIAVGLSLVGYCAALIRGSLEGALEPTALQAVVLNGLWLAGTVVVLVGGWLTDVGTWALVAVGGIVAVFTVLEIVGLRKASRRARGALDPSRA